MRGFYFITHRPLSRRGLAADVQAALAAGVRVVQYRDKDADTRTLYAEARRLRELCRGVLFLVNDRVDVALAVEADGVHLGQQDLPCPVARRLLGPHRIIGVTVSSLAEARQAVQDGADYLGVSPIFPTRTKPDAGAAGGLRLLREIRAEVSLPLVALGGITLANAPQVVAAGADGLCAISAVLSEPDMEAAIRRFQSLFATGGAPVAPAASSPEGLAP
ncbi:MAG: thiamine phosphate synthase [Syntrophobacterales bacterium]|nr:thiamine phosphate synthase [Syntrophobacterales bacterium]